MYINVERNTVCRVCNGVKAKEIGTVTSRRVEDWFYYPVEGEVVVKIFCSQCGIVYHESSI